MRQHKGLVFQNLHVVRKSWGKQLSPAAVDLLKWYTQQFHFSILVGDLLYLEQGWYVTHSGLIRLAERRHCAGMHVRPVLKSSAPATTRAGFRASRCRSRT